ncbi:MAG TPA: PAS domain S-box protein [Cyclobacteriaceae bacterium]|nr:PAS domain S-box protein [Cyclobacteriaceae bacterium]
MQESIPDQDFLTRDKFLNTLAESYVLHETILNSTELSVMSAQKDGVINSLNKSAERILGYDADELIGKHSITIAHKPEELAKRAEELTNELGKPVAAGFDVLVAKVKNEKGTERREWTYVRKDKSTISVSLSVTSIWDERGELSGFLAIATDVTEQKKSEQALIESEERFRFLAENVPGVIYLCREDDRFSNIFISANIEKITGYTNSEFLDGTIDIGDLIHREDFERVDHEFKEAIKTRSSFSMEYRVVHRSGLVKWVKESGAGIMGKDGTPLIEGYISDITERKKSEEALLLSKVNVEAAARELQQQNYQLNEFAHIISHNLRAPVGNIQALISLLHENSSIDDFRLVFQNLHKTAVNLRETLNELLELLRVNKEHEMERTPVRFDGILQKVKEDMMGEILNTNAWIISDFGPCGEVQYYKPYLESIMLNLLSNALKYRYPGRDPEIRFETHLIDERPVLKVHDNGLGINLEKHGMDMFGLRKVFHGNSDAHGVGLFLTKTQVEALGGKIRVESIVNQGSTFIIEF